MTRYPIPEIPVEGKPLGRHVNHDPRSLRFLVGQPATALRTIEHTRISPILDQGQLGSCVGNAAVGCLGTEPFYRADGPKLDEALAVKVYSSATELDPFDGSYPPDDTGSDGLSGAKALKNLGLISGYLHATSLSAMQAALQSTPVMVGVNWYASFDDPDPTGLVGISGQVRGGHEFEVVGIDMAAKTFTAVNSWGPDWGDGGHFRFTFDTMARLLFEDGDCTQLVPLTVAPPTPAPIDADLSAWWAASKAWAGARHVGSNKAAALAATSLAQKKGLT